MGAWLARGINAPALAGGAALGVYAVFGAGHYDLRILTIAGAYAILALGYQFVFGHAGALSLAQGAFFGVGAYVSGLAAAKLGIPVPLGLLLAVVAAVAVAAVIAWPVLRLESHYFALATLGIAQVLLLAAINWQGVTGGANGVPGIPPLAVFGIDLGRGLGGAVAVWVLVGILGLFAARAMGGLYGTLFAMMRGDALTARASGIDVGRLRFVALLLSAGYGGLAGALYVHAVGVVSPDVAELSVLVTCLAIVVIGGRFHVAGAIAGALLLVHLPEWFRGFDRLYLVVYGLAMLAMVIAVPDGLVGALIRLRRRLVPEARGARPAPVDGAPPGPIAAAGETVLVARDLARRFGGVRAVDGVSLELRAGEIVGLIGPNGSGKTTLVNLLSGVVAADRGTVHYREKAGPAAAHDLARRGLRRSFQTVHLPADLTPLEIVAAAIAATRGDGLSAALQGSADAGPRAEAMQLLARADLADLADERFATLPHGARRRVDLVRAALDRPRVLLLDEPAAGLAAGEQAWLAGWVRDLAARGAAIVIVEHDMEFLMPLADRLVCLDTGRVIAAGTVDEVRRDPAVRDAYLGREDAA